MESNELIREVMKSHGLTVDATARLLGVATGTVRSWLYPVTCRARRVAPLSRLIALRAIASNLADHDKTAVTEPVA